MTTTPAASRPSRLARTIARHRDPSVRRRLTILVAVALVVASAWGVMNSVDPASLRTSFADVSWPWVVAAAAAYAAVQLASAMVWKVGLEAGGIGDIDRGHVVSSHWLGRGAGELLPAHLGETIRYAAITRHPAAAGDGLRIAGSMGAFKALDGVMTFGVVALAATVAPLPQGFGAVRWIAGGMLAGLLIMIWLLCRVGPARLARLVPRRARGSVAVLGSGAGIFACRRSMLAASGFQLTAIALRVASLAALLLAFGLPVEAAPLVFGLTILANMVALSPGAAGVREAAVVPVVVATYGVGAAPVLAFSIGVQALALAVSVGGAAIALMLQRRAFPAAARLRAA